MFLKDRELIDQVKQGMYCLLGSSGDIIVPEVWEVMVELGWKVIINVVQPLTGVRTPLTSIKTFEIIFIYE